MKKYQYIKKMQAVILIIGLAAPFLLTGQVTLNPDNVWLDQSNTPYYDKGLGTAFYNYNGIAYIFNYQSDGINKGGHTYMYTVNKDHNSLDAVGPMAKFILGIVTPNNKIEWGYPGEASSYDEGQPLGRVFAFQFNERLWYFQHIRSAHQLDHQWEPDNESYECYAQVPLDTLQKCFTYYQTHSPVHTQLKMGAFQLDSMLYFVSKYSDGNMQWMIQEFSFDEGDNKFHYIKDIMLPDINTTNLDMLGGLIKRLDADGNAYMILNLYSTTGGIEEIGKLTPSIASDGTRTFTWVPLFDNNHINPGKSNTATTIVEGTMKACRTSDPLPQYPDRLVWFGVNQYQCSEGYYKISFREFYFENDVMILGEYGEINPPQASAPDKIGDNFQLLATFELQPRHWGDALDGVNGYQQYIWLMYPDHDKHFSGLMLESDQWGLTNETPVSSADLWDNQAYPGIEGLWSLVGICDGGPPVSIDWEVWENPTNHDPGVEPSELLFTVIAEHQSEVSSTYEDQWSIGANINMNAYIEVVQLSRSDEFKYTSTYKNTVANGSTVTNTLTQTFGLMEENQDFGKFIFAVPTINRYHYKTYPWWDEDRTITIPNSDQYLFRVVDIAIILKQIPIEEFPFEVNEPNGDSLSDWTATSRDNISSAVLNNSLRPIITATWTGGEVGQGGTHNIEENASESYEHSTEYEVDVSVGVGVPAIFKTSVSGDYKASYSNKTTVKNTFGTEIEIDISNLKSQNTGPNIEFLSMSAYWFLYSSNPNWWFYDSLGDQRPWYIGYIVNGVIPSIKLISPQNKALTEEQDLFFTWEIERGHLDDLELVISNSSMISNSSIIYQEPIKNGNGMMLSGFKPEPGKTYHWAVKGMTDEQQLVWSDMHSFTMGEVQAQTPQNAFKAVVYPNPSTKGNINIMVDPQETGQIEISLFALDGILMATEVLQNMEASPVTITLSGNDLMPGIYFAVIRSGNEKLVRKVMVK